MLFAVTGLLLPSRLQSPSFCPVETIAAPEASGGTGSGNGAERNRTAVRNTGVSHLVGPKADPWSMAPVLSDRVAPAGWASPNHGWGDLMAGQVCPCPWNRAFSLDCGNPRIGRGLHLRALAPVA